MAVGLLLPAVQKTRAAAAKTRCQNHLRQIGLAHHQHHDSRSHLPPGVSIKHDQSGQPYMSWHARLLPYLEHDPLWKEIQEAYRAQPNFLRVPPHVHLATLVPVFTCPADERSSAARTLPVSEMTVALTDYLGVHGTDQFTLDGLLYRDSTTRFAEVRDGTSNTLLVGERPPQRTYGFGWWYAGWGQNKNGSADMILGAREVPEQTDSCPPPVGGLRPPPESAKCEHLAFWSYHPGGANFLFADGSVRLLRYDADSILPALATRAGGEVVTLPE